MALSEHQVQPVAGVYAIRHLPSGKCYVGSAKNMRRRWNRHRVDLLAGVHHSVKLQRAWDKYGAGAFSFEVLQLVHVHADLVDVEQSWIDLLDSFANGYNSQPKAASCLGTKQSPETIAKRMLAMKGYRPTPETIEKIRQANRVSHGTPEARLAKSARLRLAGLSPSPETRAAVAKANRERVVSKETRAKMSASKTGRVVSELTKARISAAKLNQSPETKAKISAAHTGKVQSAEHIAKRSLSRRLGNERRKAEALAREIHGT